MNNKPSLRDLARQIERVASAHPCASQVYKVIDVVCDFLNARARLEELNASITLPDRMIEFDYINHEEKQSQRHITIYSIRFGTSEWYPEPQWLILAWDHDKEDWREFAVNKMFYIRPWVKNASV